MKELHMQRGEKFATGIGLFIILMMGSLIAYMLINFDEIQEEQFYRTLQYFNSKDSGQ
ncbi:MAG: hypothetical protein HQM14_07755 [SAR324 cluster bacterium]|nr:hypothetical protein [SAR324 cluster bacterium]